MKGCRLLHLFIAVILVNIKLKLLYGLTAVSFHLPLNRIRGGNTIQHTNGNHEDRNERSMPSNNNQRTATDFSSDIQFKNSSASTFSTIDESTCTGKMDPSPQQSNSKWFNWRSIKIFEPLFERLFSLITQDPDILRISSKICAYLVWTNILLSTLGTTGVDIKPILSLLSISALTVGFAAKDLLTDTFAGVSILILRPFQRGDVITVGGFKGTVLSIDLKYVKLASSSPDTKAAVILIPLAVVYKGIIIRHNNK